MDPFTSEIAILEPDVEKEAPVENDLASTAEESPDVSTSEPETSYTVEVIPEPLDDSLAESAIHDDENAVNQTETMGLQSELQPNATEAEYTLEEKTDVSDDKPSDSAPILAAAQQLPEVVSQEVIQPQSTEVLVTKDDLLIKTKHYSDLVPGVNNLEHDVKAEATVDIEQETELDTAHSDEPAGIAADGLSKVADATGGIEHQSEFEQETPTPSAQETGEDVVSGKDALRAVVAHEDETEMEAETEAATATNDLAAADLPETEQPVMPTTEVLIFYSFAKVLADLILRLKGDSTKHVNEVAIAAVGLAALEGSLTIDRAVAEDTHEATAEAGNDLVESRTTLNIEPQREHEFYVTAPEAEDTHPDMDSSLHNDPTPVPLPLEPERSLIETELAAERQVETTSIATTMSVPIDAEDQPNPSLSKIASNAQKYIGMPTQVDDTSNINGEPIPESEIVEAADAEIEGSREEVPASIMEDSQSAVQLEPEVGFVAPAEEESLTIAQAEHLLPKIESEALPIPEDVTSSVTNVEDQIVTPVDVRSEHAAVVDTSTDEPAEVILPDNVEESPETLTPLVESHMSSGIEGVSVLSIFNVSQSLNSILKSHVVPEENVNLPETQVLGDAALMSIMAATAVESDLGRGDAEKMSISSQELPVNPEVEETVTHEEAVPISSTSLEISEVDVPITTETEPESRSTNSISEDNVSTFEVEGEYVLLSPKSREPANIELNDDSIPFTAAEPGPEIVEAVVAPVLGTSESQAQGSVEETAEVSLTIFLQQDLLLTAIKSSRKSIPLKLPVKPGLLFQTKVSYSQQ